MKVFKFNVVDKFSINALQEDIQDEEGPTVKVVA